MPTVSGATYRHHLNRVCIFPQPHMSTGPADNDALTGAQASTNLRGRPRTAARNCEECLAGKRKCGPQCRRWAAAQPFASAAMTTPTQLPDSSSAVKPTATPSEGSSDLWTRRASARRNLDAEDPEHSQPRQRATGKRWRAVFAESEQGGKCARQARHQP